MTVSELISALKQCNPDRTVYITLEDDEVPIAAVTRHKHGVVRLCVSDKEISVSETILYPEQDDE